MSGIFTNFRDAAHSFFDSDYDLTYRGLILGEFLGVQAVLGQLRRIGISIYLVWLLITNAHDTLLGEVVFTGFIITLVVVQVIFGILESKFPQYQAKKYRLVRLNYYFAVATILTFIGKGSGSFIVLYIPYLMFATMYVGKGWDVVAVVEATCLTFITLFLLMSLDHIAPDTRQLLTYSLGVLVAGLVPLITWRKYLPRISDEYAALRLAIGFTSINPADEDEVVYSEVFKLLGTAVDFETAALLADMASNGNFELIGSVSFPDDNAISFTMPDKYGSEGLTGEVLRTRQILRVDDLQEYIQHTHVTPKFPKTAQVLSLSSYLGIPLSIGERLIGVLILTSRHKGAFSDRVVDLMHELGSWLAIVLESTINRRRSRLQTEFLQQIVDLSNQAILVSDSTGRTILHNTAARRMLSKSYEELSAQNILSLVSRDDPNFQQIKEVIEGTESVTGELQVKLEKPNGENINALFASASIVGANGSKQSVSYLISVDVLPIDERRLRALLEVGNNGVIYPFASTEQQAKRILEIVDQRLYESYGVLIRIKRGSYLEYVAASSAIDERTIKHKRLPFDASNVSSQVLKTRTRRLVTDVLNETDYTNPQFATEHGYRSAYFLPLAYRDIEIGTLAVYHKESTAFSPSIKQFFDWFADQTTLVLAGSELAIDSLKKQTFSLVGEVAIDAVSKMSDSLTLQRGWSQLLIKESMGNSTISEAAESIVEATSVLESIANEILAAHEILEIDLSTVSLQELVANAVRDAQEKSKGVSNIIDIVTNIHSEMVQADVALATRAVASIVENAIDAQPNGAIVVISSEKPTDAQFELIVKDYGPGISVKDFDDPRDIFRPFSSTKAQSRQKGFGLGLVAAYQIISAHSWKVSVENSADGGAEIRISGITAGTGSIPIDSDNA